MSKPTNRQYACIWQAFKDLKWNKQVKEELVYSYTQDAGKLSLTDLTFEQAADLVTYLNNLLTPSSAKPVSNASADKVACNAIRRRILAFCHQLGWYVLSPSPSINGIKQLDYSRIDAYCIAHTGAKKALNKMSKEELQKAAYQFEKMYKNYITKPAK